MKTEQPLSSGFIRLYVLALLYFSANSILTVLLPLRSEAEGMKQTEIGVMMGAYMLVCMLIRPWAGKWVARFGAKRIMQVLLTGHALCLVLYIWSGTETLIAYRAYQGVLTACFSMAMQMGMVEMLQDKDRAQGLSLYSLSTMMPQLFGPITALFIWNQDQAWLFAGAMGGLALLTLLVGLGAPLPKNSLGGGSRTDSNMMHSLGEFKRHSSLMLCMTVMMIGACMFGAVSTFLPLYMITTGSGNPGLYLMLQAAIVVVSRFTLRKRIPSDGRWHPWLIGGILLSTSTGTLMLVYLQELGPLIYASALFNGLAVALLYPTLTTYLTFVLPEATRHTLLGLFMSSYDLGFSLGGLVMGIAAERLSYPGMFAAAGLLGIAGAVLVFANRKAGASGTLSAP